MQAGTEYMPMFFMRRVFAAAFIPFCGAKGNKTRIQLYISVTSGCFLVYTKRINRQPMNVNTPTDEELVKAVQRGDKEEFGILVARYGEKLFRYGRRFLSGQENIEDVVQEVFLRAYQNIRGFDTSQKFSPWIYRIAHNTFVNALKKSSRSPLSFFDFDTFAAHPVYEDPSEKEREQKEMRVMIEKGLDSLNANSREIIILYFLEEQSYREISDILRIPIGTVGIRLKRAKEALRAAYEKLGLDTQL